MDLQTELLAPLADGAHVGEVRVSLDDEEIATVPLMALHEVMAAGLWTRIMDEFTLWLQ
jgi:D-alanyl-D-alanine carboxypeptidase (penicillin-binding protein 5/6)